MPTRTQFSQSLTSQFWLGAQVWLIVLLLPLYYWRFSIFGLPTNFIELAIIILAVGCGWDIVRRRDWQSIKLPYWLPILLILGGLTIGTAISPDSRLALGIVKGWFVLPIIFAVCYQQLKIEGRWQASVLAAVTANLGAVSLYALLQFVGYLPLLPYQAAEAGIRVYVEQGRAIGFFESPNYLAMYLVPLIVFIAASSAAQAAYNRLNIGWYLLPASLGLIAVWLTGSRGGLLGLAVALLWLGARRISRGQALKRSWWLVGLLLPTSLIIAATLGWRSTDVDRLHIWQTATRLIQSQPLTGIGPGQFGYYFLGDPNNAETTAAQLAAAYHPHNLFLGFWLSGGLLSLVGLIWLLARVWQRYRLQRTDPIVIGATAALLAIVVHGLVDTTYFKNDLSLIFWWLIVLVG